MDFAMDVLTRAIYIDGNLGLPKIGSPKLLAIWCMCLP